MDIDTNYEYSSSSEFEFLASTDPSGIGLLERESKKRTDPVLQSPIPGLKATLDVSKFMGFCRA